MGISAASGTVKITTSITSGGNTGARAANETADAIKRGGTEARKSTEAAGAYGQSLKDLKGSFGPLNQARETWENIKSNIAFLPGILGGAVAAVTELVPLLFQADSAQKAIAEHAEAYAKALGDVRQLIEKGGGHIAAGIESGTQRSLSENEIRLEITLQRAALAQAEELVRYWMERANGAFKENVKLSISRYDTAAAAIKNAENALENLHATQERSANAAAAVLKANATVFGELSKLSKEIADHWSAITVSMSSAAALGASAAATFSQSEFRSGTYGLLQKIGDAGAKGAGRGLPDRKKGGGSGLTDYEFEAAWNAKTHINEPDYGTNTAAAERRKQRALDRLSGPAPRDLEGGKFNEIRLTRLEDTNNLEAMNTQLRSFQTTIGALSPMLGQFGSALGEISQIWTDWGEGGKDTAKAVVGSLGAIAKAGAAQIKNERLRAGVMSAIELGLGFGSLAVYDYGAAAAHFTASALLGAQAIFSGGSSGSSRGNGVTGKAAPPSVGGGSGGGNLTNITFVINGSWIGTGGMQQTAAELRGLLNRYSGNGYS